MFWKRPLVCKWEGGSLEAPKKVMSLVERAKAFSPVAAPDANLWSGTAWLVGHMKVTL